MQVELLEHGPAEAMRTAVCALVQDMMDDIHGAMQVEGIDSFRRYKMHLKMEALANVRNRVSNLEI